MEKIKVNMSPNPLDVQTIHASQNDNEGREWEFELHNNGEVIDAGGITEQMVFKSYKGGTEQILPENGAVPVTAPFVGDIKYHDTTRTDQEFLYRQSPTEEDGNAKITSIKGNTLVWNQLVQNGNFTDGTNNWSGFSNTTTVSNNKATVKCINTTDQFSFYPSNINFIQNHKYLITFKITLYGNAKVSRNKLDNSGNTGRLASGVHAWIEVAFSSSALSGYRFLYAEPVSDTENDYYTVENAMIFDLTKMGLDISSPSDFTSLFSLPYYDYNQGTLLSFNGNGIKTVGKNLVFKTIPSSTISGGGAIISTSSFQMSVAPVLKGKEYVITTNDNSKKVLGFFYEEPVVGSVSYNAERIDDSSSYTFTSPITGYVAFRCLSGYSTPMLEFGSTSSDYEPYTSSTLSLPISTYFSNGMDGVGTDYDELTNTKATTRMTRVDLGSLDWNYNPTYGMYSTGISNSVKKPSASSVRANAISTVGTFTDWATFYASGTTSGLLAINTSGYIGIATTETNSTTFKNSLQGVYLVYPLATPIETSFTTASLVTENAEIPLSNEDGVLIGKCTEQLSNESGFFDAKIKLADEDGECYSNKIQLHVERSPQ